MSGFRWHAPWWRFRSDSAGPSAKRVFSEEELESKKGGEDLNPALLIPGIGGSILNAVSDKGAKERVWVRLFLADREFRSKLWSKYDSGTGRTESLDPSSHIEVPEDNYGLYSCDILDPDIYPQGSLELVNYFHGMIVEMRKWGYVDGTTLFGFGYDFRQSNRLPATMERLKKKLQSIYEATGKKVDVITHSMGGLLFKSFVALHYHEVAQYVNKWVAIAAPFRGSPGFIMDTILTGVEFLKGWESSLFITKWSMHQLLVECPSVYELIADYHFPWEETPELRIVRLDDASQAVQQDSFRDLPSVLSVMEKVLEENKVELNGQTIPLPLNQDIVDLARGTRELWRTAQLPECVEFFTVYGVSLDTPFHSTYGSQDKPIVDFSDILHTDVEFVFKDGDGTVPVESSTGDGFQAMYRVGVPGEHKALLSDARVHRILSFFLKVPPHDELYDPYTDCVLLPGRTEIEAEMRKLQSTHEAVPKRALGFGTAGLLGPRANAGDTAQRTAAEKNCARGQGEADQEVVEITVSTMPEEVSDLAA